MRAALSPAVVPAAEDPAADDGRSCRCIGRVPAVAARAALGLVACLRSRARQAWGAETVRLDGAGRRPVARGCTGSLG
jgi:hypothetical protein